MLSVQAALACLSAVLTSVAPRQPSLENPLSPDQASDYSPQPSREDSVSDSCKADEPVYNSSLRLSVLMEPLLPSLLSCLEDDGQPDTRSLTGSILGQLFGLLRGTLQLSQRKDTNALQVAPGAETQGGSLETGRIANQQTGTCSSPTPSYVPAVRQREYLALCSSLYAPLLQRLDDARSSVRICAARALFEMLTFLRELKRRSREAHSFETSVRPAIVNADETPQSPHRTEVYKASEDRRSEEKVAEREGECGKPPDKLQPDPEPSKEVATAESPSSQAKARGNRHETSWSWQCLEFLLKGLMTFIDDKDEELAGVIAEAAQVAGQLNPDLLRRVITLITIHHVILPICRRLIRARAPTLLSSQPPAKLGR